MLRATSQCKAKGRIGGRRTVARDRSDLAAKRCFDRGKSSREKYDTNANERGARETSIRSGKQQSHEEGEEEEEERGKANRRENLCHTFLCSLSSSQSLENTPTS